MRKVLRNSKAALRKAWWWLRQVSGDAAYENYLRHAVGTNTSEAGRCAGHPACRAAHLSRREFYQQRLDHHYTGITRCC